MPGLAESWEVSDDELTWTYNIREGVKWSDGQPLTAKDAAYTFNRIMKGSSSRPRTATTCPTSRPSRPPTTPPW